ncbi:hypothetical protein [Chromobacterium sphagni]|uniref:Uncharacterized protein n=1 Tax=Chromobacterium sphagni TaxID=1903179 RepID=A0A1S1WZ74_9NEIS|nr:hypothetical protein [Chromobacterium sphagni]OHX12449.1 hypothetical protein BI347_02255 [Chromobacterium sphagni]OHX21467.1 hypothetical protein BI344_02750 [Chromobacterium sphagni]
MKPLTIEDIDGDAITIRLVNTAKTYRIALDKMVKLQDIQGLDKDEILLAGVVAGKVARRHPPLLAQYDFSQIAIGGDFRLKSIAFDKNVSFVADESARVSIPCRDLLSNLDVIGKLSDELAFYIGFLYAAFILPDAELTFQDHPRPYLTLK